MRLGAMWKGDFLSVFEIMDHTYIVLAKLLCDREYSCRILFANGCRVWEGIPHTHVNSLVKYPRAWRDLLADYH